MSPETSKTLLTIAGFDPSSGAGITADLAVFAAHGFFGTSAITALTVQNTGGVRRVEPVTAPTLRETLTALQDDLPPAGVKIGMLGNAAIVEVVIDYVRELECPVVLDPVIRSSSGRPLLDDIGLQLLKSELLPAVDWVTPNIEELELLGGVESIQKTGTGLVVTGGHLETPDDLVFAPGEEVVTLTGERIATNATHGTGCAFSSAMLCGLVSGLGSIEAAAGAKEYVRQAMLRAAPRGSGKGPLNLLWKLGC